MNELQALMGDSYKEGLTVEDITNFMKGKKFADLSQGGYVDVNKYNNEIANLNKTITDKDNTIKAKDNELKSKMSDEDLVKAAQKEKDDEIERLKAMLSANTLSSNKSIANSSLVEGLNLLGIKEDDDKLKSFIDNITTEDTDKTSSMAKYVNQLIKDAYEKGKKDSTKDAMGNFGKQKGSSSTGSNEIGALGKELAQSHNSKKTDFDYFKKD